MARAPTPLDAFPSPAHLRDLVAALDALDGLSRGRVDAPYLVCSQTGEVHRGGPRCAEIFGPDDATAERWGHVDLPFPLLHPRLAPLVASPLGLSPADVLAVARYQAYLDGDHAVPAPDLDDLAEHAAATGPGALGARLAGREVDGIAAERCLVARVPVPPLADRPGVRMPGGQTVPGELDHRFAVLVHRAARWAMLSQIGAPAAVMLGEGRALVRAFEAVLPGDHAPGDASPATEPEPLRASRPDPAFAAYFEPGAPREPLHAAFVGEDGLLVQLGYAAVALDAEGAIADVFARCGARLRHVSADGRLALFAGPGGLHLRDLREHRWVEGALPDDLPTTFLAEDHEQAFLCDPRRDRYERLVDVVDYPALEATSPDGRYLWVEDKEQGGGIYDVERGLRVMLPRVGLPDSPPLLERDGVLEDEADRPSPPIGAATAALALTDGDRFCLAVDGVVHLDGEPVLRLAAPAPVVALARGGERLLVVRRDVAVIVSLSPSYVQATLRLDELGPALTLDDLSLPGGEALSDEARHALLMRFGGAWGLAQAAPSEVAEALGDEGLAEQVVAACVALAAPERVSVA